MVNFIMAIFPIKTITSELWIGLSLHHFVFPSHLFLLNNIIMTMNKRENLSHLVLNPLRNPRFKFKNWLIRFSDSLLRFLFAFYGFHFCGCFANHCIKSLEKICHLLTIYILDSPVSMKPMKICSPCKIINPLFFFPT